MVKKTNKRVMITMTEKQHQWLLKTCKKLHLTPSKYISWLMVKKAEELKLYMELKLNPEEGIRLFEEVIEIAKTKWLED